MDFGKAFSYQFESEDWWKSLLLTGLIALIPVVGVIYVLGWMMEIAGRFVKAPNGASVELPPVDFGGYLRKGFLGIIAGIAYSIPTFIFVLPIIIAAAIAGNQGGDAARLTVTIVSICCGGLAALVGIAGGLMTYPALIEIQLKDSLGAAFNFKRIFAIFKGAIVPYLLSILIYGLVTPILSSLGALLCGLGALFTMPYAISIMGYFLGIAYKEGAASVDENEVVEL